MRAPALGFLILLAGACSSSTVNPGSTGGTGGGGTDAGGGQAGTDAGSDAISSGGSAGSPSTCGNGTCDDTEALTTCVEDCGSWWIVETTLNPSYVSTMRAELAFTPTELTIKNATSSTGVNVSAYSRAYAVKATRAVVVEEGNTPMEQRGQISRNSDFAALAQVTKAVQSVWIRRSTTAPPIGASYAIIGMLGDKSSATCWALRGSATFDTGNLQAGSYSKVALGQALETVTFEAGQLMIEPDGRATFSTKEIPWGGDVEFSGFATPNGGLIVFTYNVGGDFRPGTIVFVQQESAPALTLSGTYQFASLYRGSSDFGAVRGPIKLTSSGQIESGTTLFHSSAQNISILGKTYAVDSQGRIKLDVQDAIQTLYHAGQLAPNVDEVATLFLTENVKDSAFDGVPYEPSVAFWVLE